MIAIAVRAVALVADLLVVLRVAARGLLDRPVDIVPRHRVGPRLLHREAQARVLVGIGVAHLGGDGDLLRELGEQLRAGGVLPALAMLDVGPFGMPGHGGLRVSCARNGWLAGVLSHQPSRTQPGRELRARSAPRSADPDRVEHVDQSSASSRSMSRTVICSVAPSMSTRPKNCRPAEGGRFGLARPAAPSRSAASGPKVMSSSFGPKVPACSGPGDELPERVEVLELRLVGVVVVRGRVVHVRGQPDRVGDARRLDEAQQVGDLELAAERPARGRRWRRPRRRSCRCRRPRR